MMGRVLVVDDEVDIQDLLCFVLDNAGYETRSTGRGDLALELCAQWNPDLVVLDIGLPGLSGLEVCPRLVDMGIPVLVLSSHDKDDQVVAGLELGAEDYVSKPFNYKELLLRVEKIIRRTRNTELQKVFHIGDILIDLRRSQVEVRGQLVNLTPTEFKILALLASHRGSPISVDTLLHEVWHVSEWTNGAEMVKVNISRLRKKIEVDPGKPRYLLNRWGYGYLLTDDPADIDQDGV